MGTEVSERAEATRSARVQHIVGIASQLRGGERFATSNLSWTEFWDILTQLDETKQLPRYSYFHGELEFMPTSLMHELWKKLLAALFERYCERTKIRFVALGQMSLHGEVRNAGLEPDECYYFTRLERFFPPEATDLRGHPPDLVIEIEVSRTVIGRLPIYAAMEVPEVWRFDGTRITVLHLQEDQTYREIEASLALPGLPLDTVTEFLHRSETMDQMSILEGFETWLRETGRVTT
jgi:Uma2 family endonuclease